MGTVCMHQDSGDGLFLSKNGNNSSPSQTLGHADYRQLLSRIVSPQPPRTLFPERGARQMPVQEHTNSIPRSCQHVRTRQEPLPNTTRKRSHVPPPSRRSSSSKPAGAFAHLPRSRDERTRLLVRLHHVHDRLLALAHMENTHVLRSSKWRLT